MFYLQKILSKIKRCLFEDRHDSEKLFLQYEESLKLRDFLSLKKNFWNDSFFLCNNFMKDFRLNFHGNNAFSDPSIYRKQNFIKYHFANIIKITLYWNKMQYLSGLHFESDSFNFEEHQKLIDFRSLKKFWTFLRR